MINLRPLPFKVSLLYKVTSEPILRLLDTDILSYKKPIISKANGKLHFSYI